MELVNEENSNERSKRHHKKKKKHKKKSKRHKTNGPTERQSPTFITINSDSDFYVDDSVTQASSTSKKNPADKTTDSPEHPTPPDSGLVI